MHGQIWISDRKIPSHTRETGFAIDLVHYYAVESLLALFEGKSFLYGIGGKGNRNRGHLFAVDGYTALIDKTSCFAAAGCKLCKYEEIDYSDAAVGEVIGGKLGCRHIGAHAA